MSAHGQAVSPANRVWLTVLATWAWLHALWQKDLLRLIILTLYYLAIIAALFYLYGDTTYTPPPFIYQGF